MINELNYFSEVLNVIEENIKPSKQNTMINKILVEKYLKNNIKNSVSENEISGIIYKIFS